MLSLSTTPSLFSVVVDVKVFARSPCCSDEDEDEGEEREEE